MILTIPWNTFTRQIDSYLLEGLEILNESSLIKTELEFENDKPMIKNWNAKCYQFLKSSFDNENNKIANSFYSAKKDRFIMGNQQKGFEQIKKEALEDFQAKLDDLSYTKRILSIADAIIKPESVKLTDRNAFTVEETLDLILSKLYDLYDNYYHSILWIIESNGIQLKRHGEERELGQVLEENGYITLYHMGETSGQLTITGKRYIEEKRRTFLEKYDDIGSNEDEINSKVDEVIKKLTSMGLAQEIIFDEILELKALYSTLNKKNWGQIVKGKLLDIGLAKLVEDDVLKYIYETLTNHHLRLL